MDTVLLKDYIEIARKHARAIIATIILCLLASVLVTYLFPKSYTSTIEVYVRHKGTQNSSYYTYDGYYSTQASVQYTSTVAGFLESLSTLSDAAVLVASDPLYKQGNFQPTDPSSSADYLASFQKNIDVKTAAPQLITVTISDPSPVVAQVWAQSLGTVLTNNLKQLNQDGDANFSIDTIHSPITQTVKLNIYIDVVIGLIVGVFLGFVIGFFLEANKK